MNENKYRLETELYLDPRTGTINSVAHGLLKCGLESPDLGPELHKKSAKGRVRIKIAMEVSEM